MAEDLGDKTELPTERRRTEARRKGQVAKSQDLASAVDLAAAATLIAIFGGFALTGLAGVTRRLLENETPGDLFDTNAVGPMVAWAAAEGAKIILPTMLIMFAVAAVSQGLQVGWTWTLHPIRPDLNRLNPANGVKRLFNKRNLIKTTLNTIKLAIVGAVAVWVVRRHLPTVVALPLMEMVAGMYRMGLLALELIAWLLALLIALGLADWAYQRWQQTQDLRMTKQEVKDERRMVDGDPEVKGRRLRMARDIAMQRIQHAVPKADVVVTNPTHFAVAIQYDADTMNAPRVVAKGADLMALRVRQIAAASGVPIIERPPLARALYHGVHVGREIPAEHYEAVAEVLAYVYRMEGRAA